ncbi:hypothetical protein ACTXT7_011609 [Hymenolepis weldensis]
MPHLKLFRRTWKYSEDELAIFIITEATYSEFVSVVCWCSILMAAIVFKIVDWILHYDVHGRLKYKFYHTFLYDYGDDFKKTDDEKREVIKQIREVSHSKWKKLLQRMVTSTAYDTEDERLDEAINAVSGAFVDFLTVKDLMPDTTLTNEIRRHAVIVSIKAKHSNI